MAPRSKLRLGAACQFAKGMDASVGEQGPPREKRLHRPCSHGSSQAQPIGLTITQWSAGPGEGYPCPDTPLSISTQGLITTLPSMLDPVLTPKDGKPVMLDTFKPFASGETVPSVPLH